MKSLFTLTMALVFLPFCHAAVFVVDNIPGNGAPYTSVQTAINAALAGDTIMVQPSPISYGNITINKQLVLIGRGHIAGSNNANIGTITLQDGSSNTVLTGMKIERVEGASLAVVHNISIDRNILEGSSVIQSTIWGSSSANNWTIKGNVIIEAPLCGGCQVINMTSAILNTNWVFRNNIFVSRTGTNSTRLFNNMNATTQFVHNIVILRNDSYMFGGPVGSWGQASNDVNIQNNIFWVQTTTIDPKVNCINCNWSYNLLYSPSGALDTLPGATNLNNVNPQFVKIQAPNNAAFTYDSDYHCATGSPGATGASDNGMLGVYGGGYRFSNTGDPSGIPHIIEMLLENVVIQQGSNATIRVNAVGGNQ